VETTKPLPGDDLVSNPLYVTTRAITIQASIDHTWKWLVQIGQGRGGFYSYEWLENLFGCDIHNAEDIVLEWQTLKGGDKIWLAPDTAGAPISLYLEVVTVEPPQTIVLHTPGDPAQNLAKGMPDASWAFILEPIDDQTTRFLIRWRATYDASKLTVSLMNHYGLEPIHFMMERKMLLGLKERAER
jgi:hypothetical protein